MSNCAPRVPSAMTNEILQLAEMRSETDGALQRLRVRSGKIAATRQQPRVPSGMTNGTPRAPSGMTNEILQLPKTRSETDGAQRLRVRSGKIAVTRQQLRVRSATTNGPRPRPRVCGEMSSHQRSKMHKDHGTRLAHRYV
jgi:hypothetical protein